MARPHPTYIYHFTHVDNLASIVQRGLLTDSGTHGTGMLTTEVGNVQIKAQRRGRPVPLDPGGVVADYVPFYFAPRSPMMYAIERGNVPTYSDGCDSLIYLVSTVEALAEFERPTLYTDRNAALAVAAFTDQPSDIDGLIDWPLMTAKYWGNTEDDPSRRERRMAECLVHGFVPWAAITGMACRTEECAATAAKELDTVDLQMRPAVRPAWYF